MALTVEFGADTVASVAVSGDAPQVREVTDARWLDSDEELRVLSNEGGQLATIDREYSEPGTTVSFVWGDQTDTSQVERHQLKEIEATVAPAPYVRGGRRDM